MSIVQSRRHLLRDLQRLIDRQSAIDLVAEGVAFDVGGDEESRANSSAKSRESARMPATKQGAKTLGVATLDSHL